MLCGLLHCLQPVSGTMISKSPLRDCEGAKTKQTFVIFDLEMFDIEVRSLQFVLCCLESIVCDFKNEHQIIISSIHSLWDMKRIPFQLFDIEFIFLLRGGAGGDVTRLREPLQGKNLLSCSDLREKKAVSNEQK